MKIRYEFVTGDTSEVEVTEEIGAVIEEMTRKAALKDRAETRRHESLDRLINAGAQFEDGTDMERAVISAYEVSRAIEQLQPQQRELVRKVYFEGRSIADIAREEGVVPSAVFYRLERIYVKLKKLVE